VEMRCLGALPQDQLVPPPTHTPPYHAFCGWGVLWYSRGVGTERNQAKHPARPSIQLGASIRGSPNVSKGVQ